MAGEERQGGVYIALLERPAPAPEPRAIAARSPHTTRCEQDGLVAIGRPRYTRSVGRARGEGRMAWRGSTRDPAPDTARRDMDAGGAAWVEEREGARMAHRRTGLVCPPDRPLH